jgi:hypothetical protein
MEGSMAKKNEGIPPIIIPVVPVHGGHASRSREEAAREKSASGHEAKALSNKKAERPK